MVNKKSAGIDAAPLRCWEFKNCTQSECPIYKKDTGEICYAIRKTLCGGAVQGGGFEKFVGVCNKCDFYAELKKRRAPKSAV